MSNANGNLRVGTFVVDATPPLGSPVAYAPARTIQDPLSARGVVLLPGGAKPIVLCSVDWICISNDGHDEWRAALARGAGTTPERVAVHVIHQHDGVRCDFQTAELLAANGLSGKYFDVPFARTVIARAEAAAAQAMEAAQPATHIGIGAARVDKVASNRRVLGPEGTVAHVRFSKCTNPEAVAAPEGTIDPFLRSVSFWHDDSPLCVLTYFASHPQSYYGEGDVTAEFVGLARAQRERELDGLPHIHFAGAGGNVAAGKYNDGSPEMRPVLTQRLATGMRDAWETTEKRPVTAEDVEWLVEPVDLPPAAHLDREKLEAILADETAEPTAKLTAARKLVFLERKRQGRAIELSCLRIDGAAIVHMPGELFVEYQLAAHDMRPGAVVCMAAYGDRSPSYIGTEVSYGQGGYETSERTSYVAPTVETVLLDGMRKLLA
jgi:hypothetical protein